MLTLTLFGTPQIILDGRNVTSSLVGRPLALLAYLAVTGKPQDRNVLADLLWTEVADGEARRNLRNVLYLLGQAIGDYLVRDRHTIALATTKAFWVDVNSFAERLNADRIPQAPEIWQSRFDLYQGEFLAGFQINGAPVFEEWIVTRRHHLQEQAFQDWQRLINEYLEKQNYAAGLTITRRMLTLQPWREEIHRQQMILLAATGQRSAALAQYEQCRQILANELAVEPMAETVSLYEQIRAEKPVKLNTFTNVLHRNGYEVEPVTKLTQRQGGGVSTATLGRLKHSRELAVDVGAMPLTPHFYGRVAELAQLRQWLLDERLHCVAILGIGGQGKTTLAAQLVHSLLETNGAEYPPSALPLKGSFETIIWRSLLNAPPLTEILQDWLQQLTHPQSARLPASLDQQFALLLEQLRRRRCLFVLDNWESILSQASSDDTKHADGQFYGQLLHLILYSQHQSCLLLTSREQPNELLKSDESSRLAGCLHLSGLDLSTGIALLESYGLPAATQILAPLVEHFSGNPLALKLVIDTIEHLFAGDVAAFLAQEHYFFGDIGALLDHQFAQLTPMQRTILHWLAIEREPVTAQTLWENLVQPEAQRNFWEALRTLQRRSLVERHGQRFGLQNVILEYTTERLIEQMVQAVIELAIPLEHRAPIVRVHTGRRKREAAPVHRNLAGATTPYWTTALNRYALLKAHAKEYVRQMQRRLLLAPVAEQLAARWGVGGMAARFQKLLTTLRSQREVCPADGYAAANLLTILLYHSVDLHGYDFSYLTLREPYLCDVTLQGVNFAHSDFRGALFTDTFEVVSALAFSADGQWLFTGSYDGLIRAWRTEDGQLYSLLDGQQFEICSLVVAPNGQWLASACGGNLLKIWHWPSTTLHLDLTVPANYPHPLAFSPDSRWLALNGANAEIHLLDVNTGALVGTLQGMPHWARTLTFSPDGAWLAAGSTDGSIYVWHVQPSPVEPQTQPAFVWRGHQGQVLALRYTPDGKTLVTSGADAQMYGWRAPDFSFAQPTQHFAGHQDAVATLTLSTDGMLLASGSADKTVRLWDMQSGLLLTTLTTEEQRVGGIAFSPNGKTLACGGSNQRIYLWDVERVVSRETPFEQQRQDSDALLPTPIQLLLRQTIYGYANQVRTLAMIPKRSLLVSGGTDKALQIWDLQTGQLQRSLRGHPGWIQTVTVSPNGAMMASADQAQQVYLWDVENPSGMYQVLHNELVSGNFIVELRFSPDGQQLASCSGTTITLWDLPTNIGRRPGERYVATPSLRRQSLALEAGQIVSFAFHPQGRFLAGATLTGEVYVWDKKSGVRRQIIPSEGYRNIAFSPDGKTLLTGGVDGTIQLWDVAVENTTFLACHFRKLLHRHTERIFTIAASPDGQSIATGDYAGVVHVWDAQTGALLQRFAGHQGWITKVLYADDGQFLVSSATDGTIKLWCLTQGVCLKTLCAEGPYAGMNITGSSGLTALQRTTLKALGAVEAA